MISFFKLFRPVYRFYIEHGVSNFGPMTYFSGVFLLGMAAPYSGVTGWLDVVAYTVLFAGLVYYFELIFGVRSLQALDPDYEWDPELFMPSLFYLFGAERTHRLTIEELQELKEQEEAEELPAVEDPFAFDNDPSADSDIPIDGFFVTV